MALAKAPDQPLQRIPVNNLPLRKKVIKTHLYPKQQQLSSQLPTPSLI